MTKNLILGSCVTGAKYTPLNHRETGDPLLDRICTGRDIIVHYEQLAEEMAKLRDLGCRYYHYHARNPDTREQTTDNAVYKMAGGLAARHAPEMLLSWGASRNGPEVMERIARFDEWERVSHAGLPLGAGGAHFVTLQAAIELQILRDLEQRTRPVTEAYIRSGEFLDDIRAYRPSAALEDVVMDTHSTANGGNYGRSSPAIQMRAYGRAIAARRALGLWHEVEWVQFLRSWAMTRFAIAHDDLALAAGGQLNVTILFGFSPKLPFPTSYQEFRTVVQAAKSLEFDADGRRRRGVTIAVGAAVLPQHARKHVGRLTEGRRVIDDACALRRLVAYAARPDSDVDILRAGMEDTPYVVDDVGRIRPTTNGELARRVAAWIDSEGANIVLDPRRLGHAVAPRHGWNEQSLERIAA